MRSVLPFAVAAPGVGTELGRRQSQPHLSCNKFFSEAVWNRKVADAFESRVEVHL